MLKIIGSTVAAFSFLLLAPAVCGSLPPSQKGFSLSNIAALTVASLKAQLSCMALFRQRLATKNALQTNVHLLFKLLRQ